MAEQNKKRRRPSGEEDEHVRRSGTRKKAPTGAAKRRPAEEPVKKSRAEVEDDFEKAPRPKKKSSAKARKKRKQSLTNVLVILFSLLLLVLGGGLYAGSCVSGSNTNLPNVYLDGIALGGLTREQTLEALNAQGWDRDAQTPLTVNLPTGVSFELNRLKAGTAIPAETAADIVFRYGHSGNWVGDLNRYVHARIKPVDLGDFSAELQREYIDGQIKDGLAAFRENVQAAAGYTVDKDNAVLQIVKGGGAVDLNEQALTAAVDQALLNGDLSLSYDTLENLPQAPDFEQIHQALSVEPEDAYFTDRWEVVDEIVGCDFNVEQALQLWNDGPWLGMVSVPLDITYPAVTGESLRSLLFRDLLGSQTTYFPNSIPNRVSNINLAASKLDGIILYPGDELSYNSTIGQRTLEAGFLEAGAYADGEVVEEIGGGICQVSSTLYCAEVLANLETVNRTNHYFRVDYLPIGHDATVSWPGPDFVFRNNRDYPIKIVAKVDTLERWVTIEIWGTNVDGTHVEITYDQFTITDPEWGVACGSAAQTYRNIYDADGNLLQTVKERYSDYHMHDEDINWPPEKLAQDAAAKEAAADVAG